MPIPSCTNVRGTRAANVILITMCSRSAMRGSSKSLWIHADLGLVAVKRLPPSLQLRSRVAIERSYIGSEGDTIVRPVLASATRGCTGHCGHRVTPKSPKISTRSRIIEFFVYTFLNITPAPVRFTGLATTAYFLRLFCYVERVVALSWSIVVNRSRVRVPLNVNLYD